MEMTKHSHTFWGWCEEHGTDLFIVSLAVLLIVLATGCGTESNSKDAEPPGPPPAADKAWDEIKPVVDRNCTKCHNGSVHPLKFDTAAKFKGSKAKARITDRTMPPAPAVMSDTDRQKLLTYLGR